MTDKEKILLLGGAMLLLMGIAAMPKVKPMPKPGVSAEITGIEVS